MVAGFLRLAGGVVMSTELDQRRDRLVHYVASQDHPWNSTETVRLFEQAVRAQERHEHGERIAKEAVDKIQRYMATRGRMGTEYDDGVDAGLSTAAAILLGDDPAPDDPRFSDPATDGAIDARMESDP